MFRRFIPVAFGLLLTATTAWPSDFVAIRIFHTNDIHGNLLPKPDGRLDPERPPMLGGAATLATAMARYRSEPAFGRAPDLVFYLDGGDIWQGTPEGNLTEGAAMIEMLKRLGLDAMAAGNHDFDLGTEVLANLVKLAPFPVLSANSLDEKTGEVALGMKPRTVLERKIKGRAKPFRLGVFGVITHDMPSITAKSSVEGLRFDNCVTAARAQADALKQENVDLVIGLTHAGTEYDTMIADSVPEAAVIIGGHSRDELEPAISWPVDSSKLNTWVVHAGGYTKNLGIVDILYDLDTRKVVQINSRLVRLYESLFPPDKKMKKWVEKVRAEVGAKLDVVVLQSDTTYIKEAKKECEIGNMMADAMRHVTGTELSFMNNRGIRSVLPKGDVSLRDIFAIMPFDNTVVTMELAGKDIMALLEESASLERDLLHMSGLAITVDLAAPVGARVKAATAAGEQVDPERVYSVTTISFLADGGDKFETFTLGVNRNDTGKLMRDAVKEYLGHVSAKSGGLFSARLEGRITVLGGEEK